jgi:hypothetical protein
MHNTMGLAELVIIITVLVLLFTLRRPRPPRNPKHPIPAHEPLHLFLRIIRRRADSWHF